MNRLIWIVCTLIFFGCKSEINNDKEFRSYYSNVFEIDSKSLDGLFYLIPLSGCDYCVVQNLTNLLDADESCKAIFVGKSNSKEIKNLYDQIIEEFKGDILLDESGDIYSYQTGFLKPILFHYSNGRMINYIYIDDDKIEGVGGYLKRYK